MNPTKRDLELAGEVIKGSLFENYEETKEVINRIAVAITQRVTKEREECAKIADKESIDACCEIASDIAKAIRARNK